MHIRLSSLLLIILVLICFGLLLPSVHASSQETLYPNGVGDSAQCTPVGGSGPNWDCVDETVSDSDTSYVKSLSTDASPHLDLYNIQPTAIPVGSTINSVTVYAVCRSLSNTYRASFRNALKKSGGTTQYGATNQPTTTYTLYSSGAFGGILQTDLDALQIGIEIISGDRDPTFYTGRCTQVFVVIDYTVVSATWKTVSTWSIFLVTRSWQGSGTWSDFLLSRLWQNSGVWLDSLISRAWQNVAIWNISLLTLGWHTVTSWSILLLGEDATTIIVILFLFSVVAFTFFGLYRRKKKDG